VIHGTLGRVYADGERVVRQGEPADDFFLVQDGQVELVWEAGDAVVRLDLLAPGDVFGQQTLFRRGTQTATARAVGGCRVLTLSRETFLRSIHEDPSLAFQMLKCLTSQIDRLHEAVRGAHGLA